MHYMGLFFSPCIFLQVIRVNEDILYCIQLIWTHFVVSNMFGAVLRMNEDILYLIELYGHNMFQAKAFGAAFNM